MRQAAPSSLVAPTGARCAYCAPQRQKKILFSVSKHLWRVSVQSTTRKVDVVSCGTPPLQALPLSHHKIWHVGTGIMTSIRYQQDTLCIVQRVCCNMGAQAPGSISTGITGFYSGIWVLGGFGKSGCKSGCPHIANSHGTLSTDYRRACSFCQSTATIEPRQISMVVLLCHSSERECF